MTIKSRNRLTVAVIIFSASLFLLSLITVIYKYIKNDFKFPDVYIKEPASSYLLSYNPNCVVISILILLVYVCIVSHIIYRVFEKTQATEMLFFILFLAACMIDTCRMALSSLNVYGAYSKLLIKLGNIIIFARILAPLSLFGAAILSQEDFRQNADQNCLILIITAIFFAEIIPINSAITLPNFSFSYGYMKTIHYLSFIICVVCILELFVSSRKKEYNQLITLGFAILCLGYSIMFESYNLLMTIAGPVLLGIGTTIYLIETHKHYLWLD